MISENDILDCIIRIRGKKIMIDRDLASIYGVTTKRLNEQVKRNLSRFPEDFLFQLTKEEKAELVANCDRFLMLRHATTLPYAFTEHGAVMLACVLNSEKAIQANIQIVRVFTAIRELALHNKDAIPTLPATLSMFSSAQNLGCVNYNIAERPLKMLSHHLNGEMQGG